ncbi:hypothetical protein TRP8649_00927 [Pelagimonas phthalicica]|uniref:Uncharacterized protein n=1 Tax=Pelagimonas phthalicica TaxID=1037362 RepID=A0A238J9D3_9RHOB|nr:hypothetical protein CLV87_1144 [Pelagimonas phthalicica]SMX26834.1 hypothetical protein TRP8649_00927 [Pelagimonas phthalicica]
MHRSGWHLYIMYPRRCFTESLRRRECPESAAGRAGHARRSFETGRFGVFFGPDSEARVGLSGILMLNRDSNAAFVVSLPRVSPESHLSLWVLLWISPESRDFAGVLAQSRLKQEQGRGVIS